MPWTPQRSLAEAEAILCGPGMPHELETRLLDGQVQRVYKHLWPNMREFWLWASKEHAGKEYAVFEGQRRTYKDIADEALRAAAVFRDVYGVKKGDAVGICSRNYPSYLAAFWACHLIGAVSVLVNAWLPLTALRHCLKHTDCKLVIVDTERANVLESVVHDLKSEVGTTGFLVFESHEGKGDWGGMMPWSEALSKYTGDVQAIVRLDYTILPEDDATILFTSGTTGLPKGVLSTQRMYVTNIFNVTVAKGRAMLRRGEDITQPPNPPPRGFLVSVPLFHVTGITGLSMLATLLGVKIVFMRKWNPEIAARLIRDEDIGNAGGVPSVVSDLLESSLTGYQLDGLSFGGAPPPPNLPAKAAKEFPTAAMSQSYGLTETNCIAVTVSAEDYVERPLSTGLPTPVNDVIIVKNGVVVRTKEVGEILMRGPNIMKGYWKDPAATAKALTKDGWFRSGDLGYLDEEGFLYIVDRIKDIIIRGGENVDSIAVENALYEDPRVLEAAAVGVPDKRLGELVTALISVKPHFTGEVREEELMEVCRRSLPQFARPVMILVQREPFERTPSGKILKGELRKIAKDAWERRLNSAKGAQSAKL